MACARQDRPVVGPVVGVGSGWRWDTRWVGRDSGESLVTAPVDLVVLGAGRAGRARIRAIEAHPRARLAAVVGRAQAPDPESLSDLLASSDAHAVVVCTPNVLHPAQTLTVLEAGKHALVEFPLAPDRRTARALVQAARARERVLHVGHIELLAPSQAAQRERVSRLGRPLEGELAFSGDVEGWIGDDARAGTPGLRAMARLHRLADLFGAGEVQAARLERDPSGYRLEVDLRFATGGGVRLIEVRAPGAPRQTVWRIRCEHGTLDSPPDVSPRGVFALDLAQFLERVDGADRPGLDEERELAVLEWIERIDALTRAGGTEPPRDEGAGR